MPVCARVSVRIHIDLKRPSLVVSQFKGDGTVTRCTTTRLEQGVFWGKDFDEAGRSGDYESAASTQQPPPPLVLLWEPLLELGFEVAAAAVEQQHSSTSSNSSMGGCMTISVGLRRAVDSGFRFGIGGIGIGTMNSFDLDLFGL
jgi:hypothetical protein